ncbi:MAG: hemolysin family protein [Thermomicrobiales bacterium]
MNDSLELTLRLLATVLLIAVNALYVFHEFAYVSLKPGQIRRLDRDESSVGKLISKAAHKLDHYIAVDQLGITVSSLAVGWIGQPVMADLINALFGVAGLSTGVTTVIAAVIAFALLTGTQMVVGELMPKTYALRYPERTARFTARAVEITAVIFHPFVALMNGIGLGAVRLLGFKGTAESHHPVLPVEELITLVKSSAQAGLLSADPKVMNRFLNFSDLRAHDLMVPRMDIVAIDTASSFADVLTTARAHQHDRYPVYQESLDRIVGMINVKDLLASGVDTGFQSQVNWQRRVRSIPTIPESTPVENLLALFNRTQAQMALLIDEFGATEGIVTITDISDQLIGGPDEIVAEPSGSHLIEGHASISIVEGELDISLEMDERHVETVAGLVLAVLGDIPDVGESVEINGHRLEVVTIEGNRITSIRIHSPPSAEGTEA